MTQTCDPETQLTYFFEGHLDTALCADLEPELRDTVSKADLPVVFDMAAATFVSSSFLRLCVFAYKQAGPGRFQVIHVSPAVKKVFKIAGLDCMLKDR